MSLDTDIYYNNDKLDEPSDDPIDQDALAKDNRLEAREMLREIHTCNNGAECLKCDDSRLREQKIARAVILYQNGLHPAATVGEVEGEFLVEDSKNTIVTELHLLEARIGKDATMRFITNLYPL